MIEADMDMDDIDRKLARVILQKRTVAKEVLIAGFQAVVDATPRDTGFLAASWQVSIDGGPMFGDLPDYAEKQEKDETRIFRRLKKTRKSRPVKAKVKGELQGPTGADSNFMALADNVEGKLEGIDITARDFPSAITFVNMAPYAEYVNGVDLQALSVMAASSAMNARATQVASVRGQIKGATASLGRKLMGLFGR